MVCPCLDPRDANKCTKGETTEGKEILHQLGKVMSVNLLPGVDLLKGIGKQCTITKGVQTIQWEEAIG